MAVCHHLFQCFNCGVFCHAVRDSLRDASNKLRLANLSALGIPLCKGSIRQQPDALIERHRHLGRFAQGIGSGTKSCSRGGSELDACTGFLGSGQLAHLVGQLAHLAAHLISRPALLPPVEVAGRLQPLIRCHRLLNFAPDHLLRTHAQHFARLRQTFIHAALACSPTLGRIGRGTRGAFGRCTHLGRTLFGSLLGSAQAGRCGVLQFQPDCYVHGGIGHRKSSSTLQ